ncbi:MAG: hypothetical protein R3F30_11890 [Planctomycetota bacterium]
MSHRHVVPVLVLAAALASASSPGQGGAADGPQAGAAKAEARSADQDRVVLRNGQAFVGRIVEEGEDGLRIEVAPGQRIGFRKHDVVKVERAERRPQAHEEPQPEVAWGLQLAPAGRWFRLRDEDGALVGTLHLGVEREPAGYRFEEEWYFLQRIAVDLGQGKADHARAKRLAEQVRGTEPSARSRLEATLVTRIERVDRDGLPLSTYVREAVLDTARERVVKERIRQGEITDGTLVLSDRSFDGLRGRTIGFGEGTTFGLCVEERMRQAGPDAPRAVHATVYDPLTESFEVGQWTLQAGEPVPESRFPATVPTKGRAVMIESRLRERRRREWVAPGGVVLLVEVNGVELVAEPVTAESCLGLRSARKLDDLLLSPLRVELAGFEVFAPRATWAIVRPTKGSKLIRLVPSRPELQVALRQVQAPREVQGTLSTVGEALMRRFALDHAWCEPGDRRVVTIGGRDWFRMEGSGKDPAVGDSGAVLYATRGLEGYLLLECAGPADVLAELRDEIDELVASVRASGDLVVAGD